MAVRRVNAVEGSKGDGSDSRSKDGSGGGSSGRSESSVGAMFAKSGRRSSVFFNDQLVVLGSYSYY